MGCAWADASAVSAAALKMAQVNADLGRRDKYMAILVLSGPDLGVRIPAP